jgi:hypothetical protein
MFGKFVFGSALILVLGAGQASAQTSFVPISGAPVPLYDDWNLLVAGDQAAYIAFGEADRVIRRQAVSVSLLVPSDDVIAIFQQLQEPLLIPLGPGQPVPDEVAINVTFFWDDREVVPGSSSGVATGFQIRTTALAPLAGPAFSLISLATLTSTQAAAEQLGLILPGAAVVADELSIEVESESEDGETKTKYKLKVKHAAFGIDFEVEAEGGPIAIQQAANPPVAGPLGPVQRRLTNPAGELSPPAEFVAQSAIGPLVAVEFEGELGTPFGSFSDLGADAGPFPNTSRVLDLEIREKILD